MIMVKVVFTWVCCALLLVSYLRTEMEWKHLRSLRQVAKHLCAVISVFAVGWMFQRAIGVGGFQYVRKSVLVIAAGAMLMSLIGYVMLDRSSEN